jgi:alkylhydroperoxidase/carboxymuconolactone decarboxylase family protein YurZ
MPRKPESKRAQGGSVKPPRRYREFIERFPDLAKAWETLHEAGSDGPLDARTQRLVRLAVAMGALREGAVRSGARKAVADGLTLVELEQLVPLAASTLGLPAAVACWSWILDALKKG